MKKREYPKTVFRKKLIKGAFWTGFTLVLFLSVVAIVRVGNAGAGSTEADSQAKEEVKKVNLAAGEGGQTFAENFAVHYFDWENTDKAKQSRVERLSPFLASGLDEQAGLAFEGMQWNSKLAKSQIWKVEETGADSALVTLRILHGLSKVTPPDPKAVEAAKKEKKEPPKAKEEKAGPYEKYFVVPVKTDGQSFVVNKVPYFISKPTKPVLAADINLNEEGEVSDSELQEEVKTFLDTFFKVYTTGTPQELSYYVKENDVQSMNGIMTFQEVKKFIVKEGQDKSNFDIFADAVFVENQSKAQVVYPYHLTATKEEDRWLVKEIDHQ
ncbi:conjugal transfer protein [Bacillus infantis]|uniref:conjugal transfer protein n=1 Tax=Bacillus infantis TaxID=324767 RepID=UPI002002F730|nr:conjugal transfer protein [Bacillus infantis]MCK6208471.1 conjugal transfer protein [Bacillus infantis]MCP1161467.1 conjugal transfer protein [Bacillus infantis]